jgi:hypothetical protein
LLDVDLLFRANSHRLCQFCWITLNFRLRELFRERGFSLRETARHE